MQVKRYLNNSSVKITIVYFLFSQLWVLFSDKLLLLINVDYEKLIQFQIFKSTFFVMATSLLLYFLIKKEIQKIYMQPHIIEDEENIYQSLFENANDAIFLMKGDKFIECNDKSCKMFGCTKEEFIHSSPTKFSPKFQPGGMQSITKAKEFINTAYGGTPVRFEWKHTQQNGTPFDAEVSLNPLKISGEKLLMAIVRDISERKLTERKLKENQLFIRRITEQSPDIIYIYDVKQDKNIYTNKDLGEILGYDPNEIPLNSRELFEKLIHPDDLIKFGNFEAHVQNWDEEYVYKYQYRLKAKNGEWRWFSGKEKEFQRENSRINTLIGTVSEITERKKNEEAILKSENKFYTVFNNNQNLMFIIDLHEKKRIDINKTYEQITGFSREEVIGTSFREFNIVNEQERYNELFNTILEKKEFLNEEFTITTKNGEERILLTSGQLLDIENNALVLVVAKDITEQKKVEYALIESEEKYRTLFEKSKDPTLLIYNNKFIDCNSAALEILKLTNKEEIFEVHPSALSPKFQPDGRHSQEKANAMIKLAREKGYHRFEWNHIDFLGAIFPVEVSLTTIFFKGEEMIYTVWRDVAERKKAEQALINSEQRLRTIVDHTFDAMYITDLNGYIRDVNHISCKVLGYSREEFLKMTIMQIDTTFPTLETCRPIWEKLKLATSTTIEGMHMKKNGQVFPVEITTGKFLLDGEEMIIGFAHDITSRKKHEQIIKESEAKYRTIFENISDGVAILDENGKFISVNTAYSKMHKLKLENFTKLTVNDLLHSTNKHVFKEYISSIEQNGTFENEVIEQQQDGSPIYTHIKGTKINLNNKSYYLAVIRDITEKKELERKMISAIVKTEEKERERIARDLHDGLGPILSTIKLYNEWNQNPKTKTSKNFIYTKSAETIDEAVRSLREISANLSPHVLTNYGLVTAIKSFIERINFSNDISINFNSNQTKRIDKTIEATLYRILTECINNTIKYAKASNIDIEVLLENKQLIINYSDNGVGFDMQKELNNPKGQGLNNILNRVNTFGGQIKIKSKANMGTNIVIEMMI